MIDDIADWTAEVVSGLPLDRHPRAQATRRGAP